MKHAVFPRSSHHSLTLRIARGTAVLAIILFGSRALAEAPADKPAGRHQSGHVTDTSFQEILPLGLSYSVVFPATAVGSTANQVCFYNCFQTAGGTCNFSGTIALVRAASPPFRLTNLRKGTTTGGCNGTPVTLPVTIQAGEWLLTDFAFSPTSAGSFQDTAIYSVTPTGAAADTFSWLMSGATPARSPALWR